MTDQQLQFVLKEKADLERKLQEEEMALQTTTAKLADATSRLEELKREKLTILREVEVEEDFLVNTLQKKLLQVKKEKVDLENQLEAEQEYISNRLQKQIDDALSDKKKLEMKLEEEHRLLAKKEAEKQALKKQLAEMQNHIEEEEEYITNRLQKQICESNLEKKRLSEKTQMQMREKETENDQLQQSLLRLQNENFVLNQKITREANRMKEMTKEKVKLFQSWETLLEKAANDGFRMQQIGTPTRRSRSQSLPSSDLFSFGLLGGSLPTTPVIRSLRMDRSMSPLHHLASPLHHQPPLEESPELES